MSKRSDPHEPLEDTGNGRPKDVSKPIGDAVPAPVEPGLDQPLPPKTRHEPPLDETCERLDEPTDAPPADTSKPIGDALPTPVEPGLDQPLPPKKPSSR
jgi:hypothetical protein